MDLSNTDLHWKSTYNIVFFKNIYKQDIEHLSRWANNRTLSIGLETSGVARVEESLLEFQLGSADGQFKLGPDEFDSIFLKNTGLQYVYTREFELSSPLINNLSSRPPLYELYDYICNLQNNLEHALRIFRISGDPLEVLALIRQQLDSIKGLKNKPIVMDIARELYISTKIFVDLGTSVGGADKAAKEIVDQLFTIFEVLFDFSSKAAHTKTKNQSQMYKMTPHYDDAEFSLTLALSLTNYLINRIRFSCL
jgi:hypothetical protein